MSTRLSLENFEEIYHSTYHRTLSYIICKCSNIEDINDILQDTYVELYKILKRKKYIVLENYPNYVIGIAKKKIAKHYGLLYRLNTHSIWNTQEENEYEIEILSNIDVEAEILNKLNAEIVWNYIKKKDIKVVKVFYLYYYSELKISQIAKELNMSESNVKNVLYRTIKDIKENIELGGDTDV